MNEPTPRHAVKSDLAAIVAMLGNDTLGQTREVMGDVVDARYLDAFEAIDSDPNQMLMVVEVDRQIAGCLQLSLIPGLSRTGMWRGQIESVRVSSEFRGHGLGRQLIKWAIEEARRRGCGLVQLTTDKSRPDALRFYEGLGFIASHEGMKLNL